MEHTYLPSIKTQQIRKNGELGRLSKRRLKINQGHKLVDRFIEERLPEIAVLPARTISDNDFLAHASQLFAWLNAKAPPVAIGPAWGRFCKFVDAGNADGAWRLPALTPCLSLPSESLLRNAKWQRDSILLHLNDQLLLAGLERRDLTLIADAQHWIGLILYFASTRGGLCSPESMIALADALHRRDPLFCDPDVDEAWMRLVLREMKYTNARIGDDKVAVQRFFPDPITLSLIRRFYESGALLDIDDWNKNTVRSWINGGLRLVNDSAPKFDTLRQLCRVALSVEELFTPIPQIYLETACGRNRAATLPESYWRLITEVTPVAEPDWGKALDPVQSASETAPTKRVDHKGSTSITRMHRALADAVRDPKDGDRNKAKSRAIETLNRLDTKNWSLAGRILHAWGLHHLQERGNALVTIRTYYSKYGRELLAAMADAETWDAEDLYEVYQAVITEKKSQDSQDTIAHLLADFHEFARARFGLPGLLEPLTDGHSKHVHVRASFIPEHVYQHGLALIPKLANRNKHYCRQLQLLWVLAYRAGLRRNELIRIQVKDIENSDDLWLFVRNNRVAKDKTSSARRKIPLRVLLTPSELAMFRSYLPSPASRKQSKNHLLLHAESGKRDSLDPNHVTCDVICVLRQLGIPGSLHSLRHTALSRMQLIAEREWLLLERFSAYSQDQGMAIYTAVFGHEYVAHERYRALAAFAGHASPSITLSTYLHFSDLIIRERLKRSQQTYSKSLIANLTGIPVRRLNKLARATGETSDELTMSVFREAVFHDGKDLFCPLKKVERLPAPELDIIELTKPALTPDALYDCLSDWQKGFDIKQLPYEHGIPLSAITRYVANGRSFARLRTQKGHSRSVSASRHSATREIILPAKPNDRWLRKEATAIKDAFHDHYRTHRDDIEWTVFYFVSHTTTTEPYVSFTEPLELMRFLATCELAISRRCWRVELTRNPDDSELAIRRHWKLDDRYETEFISSPGGVRGYRARLYYRHQSETRLVAKFNKTAKCKWKDPVKQEKRKKTYRAQISRYSASTLRYIFPMLGIMMFEPEALQEAVLRQLSASSNTDSEGNLENAWPRSGSTQGSTSHL